MNILHLSAGELLRKEQATKSNEADLIQSYLSRGKIVPVEITCRLLLKEMRINPFPYYLIDGFPRNFNNLNGWIRETKSVADVIATVVLMTDKDSVIRRLAQRGRNDDKIEVIDHRFKIFNNDTIPVIKKLNEISPVIEVDANITDINSINDKLYKRLRYLL